MSIQYAISQNDDAIRLPETYIASSGILTIAPEPVVAVVPDLTPQPIYVAPILAPSQSTPSQSTPSPTMVYSGISQAGLDVIAAQNAAKQAEIANAAEVARQAAIQAEANRIAEELAIAAAANEAIRKEIEAQGILKVQEQIAYQAQLTIAAEERRLQEQAAAESQARADALNAANALASLDYANQLATAAEAMRLKAIDDANNVSAANAAAQIASQALRAAESARLAAEAATIAAAADKANLELQQYAADQQAAATVTNIIVSNVVASAAETKEVIIEKVYDDAERYFITVNEKAKEENAPADIIREAHAAEQRLNEAVDDLVVAQTETNESKEVAKEVEAKAESDVAEIKLIKSETNGKISKLGYFDELVEYIYKKIYANG
jgi:DNA-binding XRE family transcriptional regulator